MANKEKSILKQRRKFFQNKKKELRQSIYKLGQKLNGLEPDSPLYIQYQKRKEALEVQLYKSEDSYDDIIIQLAEENKRDVSRISSLIKERTSAGFFNPGDPRFIPAILNALNIKKKISDFTYRKLDNFFDRWDEIKNSYAYRSLYTTLKLATGLTKGTAKILTSPIRGALLPNTDNQRIGKGKYNNDNYLKQYSDQIKELGEDFVLAGGKLFNNHIKKGQLEISEVVKYLREQGRDSSEIRDILQLLMDNGLAVSSALQKFYSIYARSRREREEPEEEDVELDDEIYEDLTNKVLGKETVMKGGASLSNISQQNQAIFTDEQNKETLKETLKDFYEYIESSRKKKKDEDKNKANSIFSVLGKVVKSLAKGIALAGAALLGLGSLGIGALIVAAIAGALYFFGDDISYWIKSQINHIWKDWFGGKNDLFDTSVKPTGSFSEMKEWFNDKFSDIEIKDVPLTGDVPEQTADGKDIPEDVRQAIANASAETGLDPTEIAATIQQESGFKEDYMSGEKVSSAGAIGAMQLMPDTAKELGVNPYDIKQNIMGGSKYLADLKKKYDGDMRKALTAYNWGPGYVDKAVETYGDNWFEGSRENGIIWNGNRRYMPDESAEYATSTFKNRNKIAGRILANKERLELTASIKTNAKVGKETEVQFSSKPIEGNSKLGMNPDMEALKQYAQVNSPNLNEQFDFGVNGNIMDEENKNLEDQQTFTPNPETKKLTESIGPAPIEIPSHLGGGGLNLLNTGIRS